jgi:hypothetical protein
MSMFIIFDQDRPSDSPFVERVWSCHSEGSGNFLAVASSHWEMVVTRLRGRTRLTIHGPETRPRDVYCPLDGEWVAVRFKLDTFMPQLPVSTLLNGNDVDVPASKRSFRLKAPAGNIPAWTTPRLSSPGLRGLE